MEGKISRGTFAEYRRKKLYTRHLEKTFKAAVKERKTLRIQFKSLA